VDTVPDEINEDASKESLVEDSIKVEFVDTYIDFMTRCRGVMELRINNHEKYAMTAHAYLSSLHSEATPVSMSAFEWNEVLQYDNCVELIFFRDAPAGKVFVASDSFYRAMLKAIELMKETTV
jgi:hypothetical protein